MNHLKTERGFISLLTVSLMSMLILILTVGMARQMTGEQHQSNDSSDSVEAYYSAQAVAQYTAQELKAGLTTATPTTLSTTLNKSCGAVSATYPAPPTVTGVISCVEVETSTTNLVSQANANQTKSYDMTNSVLTDNGYINRLVFSWDDLTGGTGPGFSDPGTGVTGSGWNIDSSATSNQPPVVELNITNYTPGQNSHIDTANSGELILNPRCNTGAGTSCIGTGSTQRFDYRCYFLNGPHPGTCPGGLNPPVVQVICSGATVYRCTAEIDNVTGALSGAPNEDRTVVTVEPFFHNAQYSLKAYAENPQNISPGNPVATCLPDATTGITDCLANIALDDALIDVNVTVGQTNRRVQLEVPVRGAPGLAEVLEGDSDICKGFQVINNGASQAQIEKPLGAPSCLIQ